MLISRIAVGSIALGVTVLILAFLIFKGFKDEIQEKIFSQASHIQVSRYDLNETQEEAPVSLKANIYARPELFPDIRHIQQVAHKAGLLKYEEEVLGVVLKGIGPDFDSARFSRNVLKGRLPRRTEGEAGLEIMVSQLIANRLELDTGAQPVMYFVQDPPRLRKLTVSGIYHTGIEDFDELLVLGDLGLVRRLNNWPDTVAGGFEVFLKNFDRLDQSYDRIFDEADYDLLLVKVTDKYLHYFEWFIMLSRNVEVFLVIILAVALFNIISVTLILIMERTNMIGTLKAMGATNWQIQQVFLLNGYRMAAKGLLAGNALGLLLAYTQQRWRVVPLDPENYYMDAVPIAFDWVAIGWLNLIVVVLLLLTLLLPTAFISRISPIQAIRFS